MAFPNNYFKVKVMLSILGHQSIGKCSPLASFFFDLWRHQHRQDDFPWETPESSKVEISEAVNVPPDETTVN